MSRAAMLVVEDNSDDVALLERAIRKANIELSHAVVADGDAAVTWLEQAAALMEPPKLVLLDLKLPRRSGFDVLSWIKNHAYMKRVPVVIFTSSAVSADITRAYELGANSYLVKPATPASLLELVSMIHGYWIARNMIH